LVRKQKQTEQARLTENGPRAGNGFENRASKQRNPHRNTRPVAKSNSRSPSRRRQKTDLTGAGVGEKKLGAVKRESAATKSRAKKD
jgi:hypothetical protein